MRLFASRSPHREGIIPFYFFFGLLPLLPQVTAVFDAETFFAYIDQSCRDAPVPPATTGSVKAVLSSAGEEMNFLVTAALSSGFDFDLSDQDGGRAGRIFNAFWGQIPKTPSVWDAANTKQVRTQFEKLGDNIKANTYGIYCDASAFEWVTTFPDDTPKGDDWGKAGDPIPEEDGGGMWYIKDTARRSPHPDSAYLIGPINDPVTGRYTPGPDICTNKDPVTGAVTQLAGSSLEDDWYILLCPPAFSYAIGDQLASYGSKGPLPNGEDLSYFDSLGATMLHEFSHAVIAATDYAYRAECLKLAYKYGTETARDNADSYKNFALASYLNNNEWYDGLISTPLQAAVPPAPAAPPVTPRNIPRARNGRISRKDSHVSSKDSRVVGRAGRRPSLHDSWRNRRQGAVQPMLNATATQSFSNTSVTSSPFLTPQSSDSSIDISISSNSSSVLMSSSIPSSSSSSASVSISANSSSIVLSNPGIPSSSSSSTARKTGPSSSSTGSPPAGPQTGPISFSIASPPSSSSSSSYFSLSSTISLSTSSDASGSPFTWSGSWTDTVTPTPVSLNWLDVPTGTVAPAQQTSDAVLLGGLFLALKTDRLRLTDPDPKPRSQYIDNVNKVKDQTLALSNKLDVKPPEPDCSTTKKRRRVNRMSEKQLTAFLEERALLQDRSIFSGVASAIKDAVNDISKLISCAVNVLNNLADSINKDTPDINMIENLTDSLAAIGEAMEEDPENDPTKTKSTETTPTAMTDSIQTSTTSTAATTSASTTTSSASSSSSSSSSRPSYQRKTLQGPDAANTASQFIDASNMAKLSSSLATEIFASTTLSNSTPISASNSASTSAITVPSTSSTLSTVTGGPPPSSASSSATSSASPASPASSISASLVGITQASATNSKFSLLPTSSTLSTLVNSTQLSISTDGSASATASSSQISGSVPNPSVSSSSSTSPASPSTQSNISTGSLTTSSSSGISTQSSSTTSESFTTTSAAPVVAFSKTCNDISNTNALWVDRDTAIDNINTFCATAAAQKSQDPGTGSIGRTYDGLLLQIDWPPGTAFPTDCTTYMPSLVDDCGGGMANNPLNWKHGGLISNGVITYHVTPTVTRYAYGTCGIHVWEKESWTGSNSPGFARKWTFVNQIDAKDSQGNTIWSSNGYLPSADKHPTVVSGVYYANLTLTDEADRDYIQFDIGSQAFTTKDSQCDVGAFDSGWSPATRQMDCTFQC